MQQPVSSMLLLRKASIVWFVVAVAKPPSEDELTIEETAGKWWAVVPQNRLPLRSASPFDLTFAKVGEMLTITTLDCPPHAYFSGRLTSRATGHTLATFACYESPTLDVQPIPAPDHATEEPSATNISEESKDLSVDTLCAACRNAECGKLVLRVTLTEASSNAYEFRVNASMRAIDVLQHFGKSPSHYQLRLPDGEAVLGQLLPYFPSGSAKLSLTFSKT
jgi:hypothetical protein